LTSALAASFKGSPLRHKVTATIEALVYKNLTINNQDIGYVVKYKAKDAFRIRVLSADISSAGFNIIRH